MKCRGVDLSNCTGTEIKTVGDTFEGKYSTHIFVEEFQRLVQAHEKTKPM